MNTEKLSIRLDLVASFVPKGCKVADIGSDHAYLPCYLAKKGLITFAVAGEVAEGPFQSALHQVMTEGLSHVISVRKGDGLEVLQADADCIVIAGMGGALITSILETGKEKLGTVKRLVLQPNIGADNIRRWLLANGWELLNEEIIEEDGKIYEVLVAEKGEPLKPYSDKMETELLVGPVLVKQKSPVFQKKWSMEVANWKRIYQNLELASSSEETNRKRHEILKKITQVEEVIKQ